MRRVVITGLGIVSCLGNDKETVTANLRASRPGIRFNPEYAEMGLRSQVSGSIDLPLEELIDRKIYRFVGHAAAYAYLAMKDAIADSGLTEEQVSNPRTGLIAGSGGASTLNQMEALDILREKGVKRVGPYRVTRTMGSTVSACLATPFKIKGVNYSISSACATSAHCIGTAMEQIQMGKQDIVFAGGGEEEHWSQSFLFDAMGALSTKRNDTPEKASAPTTPTVTVSSSPAVAAWWWSRSWNTLWPVARRSTPKSSATARPPTATTWLRQAAKAPSAACRWPCPPSIPRSTT
jgi:3-oxoacyl-[acyl-carrier-protein] synthase-1